MTNFSTFSEISVDHLILVEFVVNLLKLLETYSMCHYNNFFLNRKIPDAEDWRKNAKFSLITVKEKQLRRSHL